MSLVELVVVIGILALMMTLAGEVMTITIDSTGKAKALTDVNRELRNFEQTLRSDLDQVVRGQSLIAIQANTVNAYWTADQKDADANCDPADGYAHADDPDRERLDPAGKRIMELPRADVLMIFPARNVTAAEDSSQEALRQQVVYGHAILGDYVWDEDSEEYQFEPAVPESFPPLETAPLPLDPRVDPDKPAPVPAQAWHLARRSVLLMSTEDPDDPTAPAMDLDNDRILQAEEDVVWNFQFDKQVLEPEVLRGGPTAGQVTAQQPLYFPPILYDGRVPFARSRLDPAPPPVLGNRIGHYFLPHCASFKVEWALDPRDVDGLLDAERQIYWFDPGDQGDPAVELDQSQDERHPLRSLVEAIGRAKEAGDFLRAADLEDLLGPDDPRSMLFGQVLFNPTSGTANANEQYCLVYRFGLEAERAPGWTDHDFGEGLVMFTGSRRMPVDPITWASGDLVEEDVFPAALRVTVDVYDAEYRLERPIRHVMVIPVGGTR